MGRVSRIALVSLIATSALVLGSFGCSELIGGKCFIWVINFHGLGVLSTVPGGESRGFGVSAFNEKVAGEASDQFLSFAPDVAAARWSAGTLERLPYFPDATLGNPLRGTARAIHQVDDLSVGSASRGGVDQPVRWSGAALEPLPLPAGDVSGQALCLNRAQVDVARIVGGFVSPTGSHDADNAIRRPILWEGTTPVTTTLLPLPHLSECAEVTAVFGNAVPMFPAKIYAAGACYAQMTGRTATLKPCAWVFMTKPVLPGSWSSYRLLDDASGESRGIATDVSFDAVGDLVVGRIEKGGVFRPCRWRSSGTASTSFGNAELLTTLTSGAEACVNSHLDGTNLSVGYELTATGSIAVIWEDATPKALADALNDHEAGIVPGGWTLLSATQIDRVGDLNLTPGKGTLAITGFGLHNGRTEGWVVFVNKIEREGWRCRFKPGMTWLDEALFHNRPRELRPASPARR